MAERGEQTRALIVETALRLFREQGYENTTMRAIASEAGVAVGNAYYYFSSKEHLIQAFYEQVHRDHLEVCATLLDGDRSLERRIRGVVRAKVDVIAPYHEFAGSFFKTAADPRSPLSPFSPESQPVRDESIAVWGRVLDGSDTKVVKEVRPQLPELLWLYEMGIVLFWVHDFSAGAERTLGLVDRTAPMVERLVSLSRLRVLRPLVREAMDLVTSLRDPPTAR